MNDNRPQNGLSGSPDAAAWFVRLQRHPDDRELRRAFETWLAADADNRRSWETVQGAWTRLGDLRDEPSVAAARASLPSARVRPARTRWAAGIAAMLVLSGSFLGFAAWRQGQEASPAASIASAPQALAVYATPIGGQKTVVLDDGSKVTLSTDTEVRLTEWDRRRALTVVRGEAFFKVAKNPDRPFVVTAAGRTVTALGTAFNVRVDPGRWSVGLLEGKIRVAAASALIDVAPGHELAQIGDRPWTVTARNVGDLTSWRDGRLVFENRPLGDIVEEMNRFSTRKMRIDDPALAATLLSGRFRTGDIAGFVATLEAYGMVRAAPGPGASIELHTPTAE